MKKTTSKTKAAKQTAEALTIPQERLKALAPKATAFLQASDKANTAKGTEAQKAIALGVALRDFDAPKTASMALQKVGFTKEQKGTISSLISFAFTASTKSKQGVPYKTPATEAQLLAKLPEFGNWLRLASAMRTGKGKPVKKPASQRTPRAKSKDALLTILSETLASLKAIGQAGIALERVEAIRDMWNSEPAKKGGK